jgi:hypothetical protein
MSILVQNANEKKPWLRIYVQHKTSLREHKIKYNLNCTFASIKIMLDLFGKIYQIQAIVNFHLFFSKC